jgi:CDP-4-dehydro-6-deoxyglucose reductase/ferredoxin-NAD(P)+ reductase (naphthalene dioxygenase ferredoxin-specific)
MAQIHIADWPKPVAAGRHSILEAALDAGVPFPHGCGSGECGSCKCRLIDGEVHSEAWSADALSDEEHADGLILACRSRPVGDVTVQWLSKAAVLPMVKLTANITSIDRVSRDVVVLTIGLRAGQHFNFRPGQFAKLRFNKLPARSYSIANQPGHGQLVFHIRIVPDGKVSGSVAASLRPGDPVEVRGPFGDAYWDGVVDTPLLLLAGGTGMAPILSVLDAALRDGQPAEHIHVYHGVRTEDDLYASDILEQRAREHGIRFVPVYAEGKRASARNGHLHEAVAGDFPDLASTFIHVAGPPPMVAAVTDLAVNRGARRERIRADAFHAAEPEKRGLWERVTGWGGITGWGGLS